MFTVRVLCRNAANIGERKTWTQSEFCSLQNCVRGQEPLKCICSVPCQETAKHRATFGWPPLSDVAAVMKARRETRWNLLLCPKLANRFQPFVGRSSPRCGDMWRRYCCLASLFQLLARMQTWRAIIFRRVCLCVLLWLALLPFNVNRFWRNLVTRTQF